MTRGTTDFGAAQPYSSDPPSGNRRALVERVREDAAVLDVGCGPGSAGRFLSEHRRALVDGVEPDEVRAAIARETFRDVYVGTFESALAELLPEREGAYDTLLFLDVLEHLADPRTALSRSIPLLREGGRALISVPNVAYWYVRKELLAGRWRYTESGLLDRTHLRFFTLETSRELLDDAGWDVTWHGVDVGQPPFIDLPQRWLVALERWPTLFGVQFLFEAAPRQPTASR